MNLSICLADIITRLFYMRQLKSAAQNPERTQNNVLKKIIHKNKNTKFGQNHKFADIKNYHDFLKNVPILGYEDLRSYIEEQIETGHSSVTSEKPIIYLQTSGTTGKSKFIPATYETVSSYQRAQRIFSYIQRQQVPAIFSGKMLAIVSPAIEGYMADKTPFGSMSGLVYQNMPQEVSDQYVLPPEVFNIESYDDKYLLITALAIMEPHITAIATANPSTVFKIINTLDVNADKIISFIRTGEWSSLFENIPEQVVGVRPPKPDLQRADRIENLKRTQKETRLLDIWPELKAVITWTSGSGSRLVGEIKKQIPSTARVIEMGYLASEFRGTITVDCKTNAGIPTLEDNFFEFFEKEAWDNGNIAPLTLSQIEKGKQYYIVVTALHGLYRYFINDIIEVTGNFYRTPTISFVQKGRGVTNLTGEKLYEEQVTQAIEAALKQYPLTLDFFMMVAMSDPFSYVLYVETSDELHNHNFGDIVNRELSKLNIEYEAKTKSGRLLPLKVNVLRKGTFEEYKKYCISRGQREGQLKFLHLQYQKDVGFPIENRVQL